MNEQNHELRKIQNLIWECQMKGYMRYNVAKELTGKLQDCKELFKLVTL